MYTSLSKNRCTFSLQVPHKVVLFKILIHLSFQVILSEIPHKCFCFRFLVKTSSSGTVGSTTSPWYWYCWFYHFTVLLVFSNSCINPLIYAAKYREFHHGLRRMMAKQNQVVSHTNTT